MALPIHAAAATCQHSAKSTGRPRHEAIALAMPGILFIKTSSLGDVVHHMPAVTEARRHLPDASIAWVVEEAFAPLVALHPAVDSVIPVASRRWRSELMQSWTRHEIREFARDIRALRYDHVIDTQGLVRSALIARFARGRRHGYDWRSAREHIASLFYNVRHKVDRDLHAIARNRQLTGLALGYVPDEQIDYGLDRARLAKESSGRYAVLLHATSRLDKEWPVERWIAVGAALELRGYDTVLPWGTDRERARSERIAAVLQRASIPERRPLDDVAALIAGATLVVGVDTGLLHIAAALGVPLVAIFVSSEPGLTGPMGAGRILVVGSPDGAPPADEVIEAAGRVIQL
jgi:heptosyltransferase-1